MRVRTLRKHDNPYGDTFEKPVGRVYEHPDPTQLINDKIVEDAARQRKAAAKPAARSATSKRRTRPASRAAARKAPSAPAEAAAPTPTPPEGSEA